MKTNIFIALLIFTSSVFASLNQEVPKRYKDSISIFSPKQNTITTNDEITFKLQIKDGTDVYINDNKVNVNEAGRVNVDLKLDTLGKQAIIIEFVTESSSFKVARNIIRV